MFFFAHDAPTGPGEFDTFCCVVHRLARQLELVHEGSSDFFGEPGGLGGWGGGGVAGVGGVGGVGGQGVRCNMLDALDATLQHVSCHLPDTLPGLTSSGKQSCCL